MSTATPGQEKLERLMPSYEQTLENAQKAIEDAHIEATKCLVIDTNQEAGAERAANRSRAIRYLSEAQRLVNHASDLLNMTSE
jgi:hypothetical protein